MPVPDTSPPERSDLSVASGAHGDSVASAAGSRAASVRGVSETMPVRGAGSVAAGSTTGGINRNGGGDGAGGGDGDGDGDGAGGGEGDSGDSGDASFVSIQPIIVVDCPPDCPVSAARSPFDQRTWTSPLYSLISSPKVSGVTPR